MEPAIQVGSGGLHCVLGNFRASLLYISLSVSMCESNFKHRSSGSKDHYQDTDSVSYQNPEDHLENAELDISVVFSHQFKYRVLLFRLKGEIDGTLWTLFMEKSSLFKTILYLTEYDILSLKSLSYSMKVDIQNWWLNIQNRMECVTDRNRLNVWVLL